MWSTTGRGYRSGERTVTRGIPRHASSSFRAESQIRMAEVSAASAGGARRSGSNRYFEYLGAFLNRHTSIAFRRCPSSSQGSVESEGTTRQLRRVGTRRLSMATIVRAKMKAKMKARQVAKRAQKRSKISWKMFFKGFLKSGGIHLLNHVCMFAVILALSFVIMDW